MPEKKEEKRKNVQINNKTYSLHKIVWEDIVGDSTIVSLDDFTKMKTSTITTIAYILKQDKNYLYTFASYSNDGFYGDRNIIPVGVVKNIVKFEC
jgi:hypothetical protein